MLVVKNPPANTGDTGDTGLTHWWGRFPGVENNNPLQYSCLESPTDGGTWWATVLGPYTEYQLTHKCTYPSHFCARCLKRINLHGFTTALWKRHFMALRFQLRDTCSKVHWSEIHSGILAWRILWTEEPGGLQSMGITKSPTWLKQHSSSIIKI